MKPYGREKKILGAKWKKDYHPHPKHLLVNWWENIAEYLSRSRIKQIINKNIEKELNS